MGRTKRFKDGQEFIESFESYIEHCNIHEKLANISGYCRWVKLHRSSFYAQKEFYPEAFDLIECILEDETLNNKGTNVAIVILYLKHKFQYRDRVESVNTNENTNVNKNIDLSKLSTEEIKELLKDEN